MSKIVLQSEKWDFRVMQMQMRHPVSNQPLPHLFGNFREDTGACLGVTSKRYGLVQNSELMDAALAALEVRGLTDFTQKTIVAGDYGEHFYAAFTFANKQLANAVGDIFGYELVIKNSFDRTIRAALQLYFKRLACLNGASTLEKEFGVTARHFTGVSVDFVGKAIDRAFEGGQRALAVYDQMAEVAISDEQGANVLDQLVLLDTLSGALRDDIKPLWLNPRRDEDKARNLYNLYNAITEHLTHQVAGKRFEYADKVSATALMRLVNAARHPDKLAKLIVPVPADATVTVDVGAVAEATGADIVQAEVV